MFRLRKASSPETDFTVNYCDTFFSKLKGLMFSKELHQSHGIILVENTQSRLNTSIHMMFMNYDITVLWLDKELVVVDKVLAKKWRPMYLPQEPAQYVVELHKDRFPEFEVGEQLILSKED